MITFLAGDARTALRALPKQSIQCCVTSPPYYGLRDYGVAGQIGLEPTPDEYVAEMVAVFKQVKRVLCDDGTLWLNIGDSYASPTKGSGGASEKQLRNAGSRYQDGAKARRVGMGDAKPKDLLGIPWMLAFALRADGWYLRSAIVWHKLNPMPESTEDRPTSAYELVFLLTKRAKYFYDADAIRNPASAALIQQVEAGYAGQDTKDYDAGGAQSASSTKSRIIAGARAKIDKQRGHGRRHTGLNDHWDRLTREEQQAIGSNARNVWMIPTQSYRGSHFAVMPTELAERCIKAGSRPGDAILDPFGGAGTTAVAAEKMGRHTTLLELNPAYVALAKQRLGLPAGLEAEMDSLSGTVAELRRKIQIELYALATEPF